MNCNTQNAKIKSITEKTLIVGIDVGSETHYARAFDWRNIEFSKKPFAFSNDEAGFASFKAWLEDIKEKFGKTIVLPGMEPTGHYWFNLGAFLQDNGMKPVHVNPHHVHKSKELDDNNPSKDPKTIAALVNEGRFNYPYIPTGVYAEIRSLYGLQVMTQEALIRVKNRIARWLSIYFPEYKDVYRSCDAISGVMVLKVCPLPADIVMLGADGVNKIWRDAKLRAAGMKRARPLVEAAKHSVGSTESPEAAKYEMELLLGDYEVYTKRLAEKFERLRNELQIYQSRQLEILSADAIDLDIRRQTTDPKIGFDFFNVDDDTFKKPLVDNASVEIKRAFWKDFRWFSSNNMDWAVAECQQYGTVNSYLDLLYEFHENRNLTPEQLLEKMQRIDVMERGSINSMTDHYLKELLKPLQEQCIEDRDKCAKIAHIEIAFFYLLDWEDMKCFQKEIKHDPEMYAEMVSIIFRHDGDDPEERKTEEFRNYAQVIHRLFDMAKFCPCEENGTVSYDEIKVWVDKLIRILDSNHQKEMFGYVLGRLFAYAPKTADGHYPCEAVCQIIEEYGDESLLSEYRCELFNKREIFSPSAGRAEKDIAEGYKDNAEFLSIKYPKTADVFFKMSQSYVYDSDLERRRAENGYF